MPESFLEIFEKQIRLLADRHPSLVLVRPSGEGSGKFSEVFGGRLFRVGSLSSHAIALAAGLASVGKIVVVAAERMDFAGRFWNDIRHVLADTPKNVTLVSLPPKNPDAGRWLSEAWGILRVLPAVEIFSPADSEEMHQVLEYSVTRHAPVFIRCPGDHGDSRPQPVFNGACRFSPGIWPRLRDGPDLALITSGRLAVPALLAAQKLAPEGIQATILHASSIQPIDRTALANAVRKTRRIVVCEEHPPSGCLGSAVAETLAELGLPVKFSRVSLSGHPPSPPITPETILRAAKGLFKPARSR